MANAQRFDMIAELAGNQEAYNSADLTELSLEQGIRLMQLHRMNSSRDNMIRLSTELKERHHQVQDLHKLLQLINKATNQEEGDNRGKLTLTHKNLKNPHVEFAADLTRQLRGINRTVLGADGKKTSRIDLTSDAGLPILELLQDARAKGMNCDIKDIYEGEEVQELFDALRDITKIKDNDTWVKVQDIIELRERLQQARDTYHIEFKWPMEEYSREERDSLIAAIDMTAKDLGLQNDMQMQDLNRSYQERLEILQMARTIMKALNDDKVHKARSSGSR